MTSTSASSGSSSHRRSYTRPDVTWLSRWLSNFPLHTYPEDPSSTSPNASPTSLYVVPPHPGPSSWTSADPRCLRWQIEFLFRSASSRSSAPINLVFLDPRTEDFVWGPGGQLPFLEVNDDKLTSSKQQSSLIGISGLQHWVDNYMPYPWDRPELQEKAEAGSSKPYPTQALKFEAESWVTLLEIKVTSGVLMQLLTLPTTATPPRQRPALLTRLLASNLLPSALYRLSLLRNLSYLVPFHPTAHPSPLPTFLSWLGAIEFTHPFSLPGGGSTEKNEAEWLGKSEKEREEDLGDRAQSGDWRSARSERDEARILELALAEGSGSYVDIITAACEALEAVGSRLEADGDGAESGWILGAESPTSLDALLFSLIHTILSLPVEHPVNTVPVPEPDPRQTQDDDEGEDGERISRPPARSLREAVERHPVLLKWTRRVWTEWVKPAKLFSVQSQV